MAYHMRRWKRRLQAFYWSETCLLLFLLGSLYIVNPDFYLFSQIRAIVYGVTGAVGGFFGQTRISKVISGEIRPTKLFDLSALNAQEIFSLIVTLMLFFFFITKILMDQSTKKTKRKAMD